ncbi:hypothetical protein AB1Y20_022084 [Prymnesium parvum]|uniref:JmjC domain-containing protein n=1 Tax=Prymnesium parvum TaxID=97485 RepID=A0AB34JFU3_PRYPA
MIPRGEAMDSSRLVAAASTPAEALLLGEDLASRGEHAKAIAHFTVGLEVPSPKRRDASLSLRLLLARSRSHLELAQTEEALSDADAAVRTLPHDARALLQLAIVHAKRGHPALAIAALSTAASHDERHFDFFSAKARQLGAWRVPPPLRAEEPASSRRVRRLLSPTRAQFGVYVARREPVVVRALPSDEGLWRWETLLAAAREDEEVAGDVSISASGLPVDYCRADAEHASRVELVRLCAMSLEELLLRVSAAAAPARGVAVGRGGGAFSALPERAHEASGSTGEGAATQADAVGAKAVDSALEKIYSYGEGWLLQLPRLRQMAEAARPPFLRLSDFERTIPPDEARRRAAGIETEDGCIAWVSSAGCLTPLHYDLNEGILAQMIGEKRVWLYDWRERHKLYLRRPIDGDAPPGENNWERQSYAELHGNHSSRFPHVHRAQRWVADLQPGDLLYIPASWLHEVHSRSASFSLGWRFELPAEEMPSLAATAAAECEASLGGAHEQTRHARFCLANSLREQGRLDEAEALLRSVLRGGGGEVDEEAVLAMSTLSNVFFKQRRYAEAEPLLRQAHRAQCESVGKAHEDSLLTTLNLALVVDGLGRQEEAIELLREGLPLMREAVGEKHAWARAMASCLRQLLTALGRTEEAAAVR